MREVSKFAIWGLEQNAEEDLLSILRDSHLQMALQTIPIKKYIDDSPLDLQQEYDGIIINVQGVKESVVELLLDFKKKYPLTEIVAVFFSPNYNLLLELIRLGVTDVINYPFSKTEVIAVVENSINKRFFSQKTRPLNKMIELIELFEKGHRFQSGHEFFMEMREFISEHFKTSDLFVLTLKDTKHERRKEDANPVDFYWNKEQVVRILAANEVDDLCSFFVREKEQLKTIDFLEHKMNQKSFYIINLGPCENKHYYALMRINESDLLRHEIEVVSHFSRILYGLFQRLIHSQLEDKLSLLAHRDDVTGLFNQRKLQIDLDLLIDSYHERGQIFSVLFIDIDYFKTVNDRYGHLIGSLMLVEISKEYQKVVRDTDLIYRYGGDEFVIILPGVQREIAQSVGQRILESISKKKFSKRFHKLVAEPFSISVSIGVAEFPVDADCKESIITLADNMMYKAKKKGRGTVCSAERMLGIEKEIKGESEGTDD